MPLRPHTKPRNPTSQGRRQTRRFRGASRTHSQRVAQRSLVAGSSDHRRAHPSRRPLRAAHSHIQSLVEPLTHSPSLSTHLCSPCHHSEPLPSCESQQQGPFFQEACPDSFADLGSPLHVPRGRHLSLTTAPPRLPTFVQTPLFPGFTPILCSVTSKIAHLTRKGPEGWVSSLLVFGGSTSQDCTAFAELSV